MKKILPLIIICVFFALKTNSQIKLSHNIGDDAVKTQMFSCSYSYQYWARKFILADFGVDKNEELIINTGNVAISDTWGTPTIQFNIYKIDSNFPSTFKEEDLIGSSQVEPVHSFNVDFGKSKIITLNFNTPVVIPADVEMILVEVHKGILWGSSGAFIGGTEKTNDDSWYRGCNGNPPDEYKTTKDLSDAGIAYWSEDFNFYITVNGEAKTILPFEITNDNNCENQINNFSLTNQSEVKSVVWNFNDPTSGANNTSTSIDISHQFTSPGIYNVTADVVHIDNTSYTIPKEIEILDAPNINNSVSLKQCDNSDINGFSFFNLNEVKNKIITNPDIYTITFHEERTQAENNGTVIPNLTNYKNEKVSSDKVWARIENSNGCFEVSEINLFVSTTQIPSTLIKSFYQCDDGTNTTDGIATFNFSSVTKDIVNIFPSGQQLIINYYRNEGDALSEANKIENVSNYQNTGYPNQQNIYIRVDSKVDNDCLGLGAHISLNVEKVPVANPVTINPECDNDRDGFYLFDTSTIDAKIKGSQTDVAITYFNEKGKQLSSPLPNPFKTASQTISAKIINTASKDEDGQCYDETSINFIVNSVPIANPVVAQERCDDDTDGIVNFDTSTIENTILGTQTGLVVKYFDSNNNLLPSPLPNPFYTSSQKIKVRVENPVYDVCYEETDIDFIVREKPTFDLIDEDIICMNNNPQLKISIEKPNGINSYTWRDENNTILGKQPTLEVTKGGLYKVIATSIYGCESIEKQILVKESSPSTINFNDLKVVDDSENNSIEINTSDLGLGNYEFRLLDKTSNIIRDYQDEPFFNNLDGGVYTLEVNDKNGCSPVSFDVSLLSFSNFFTPNGDGKNDFWQIKGISKTFYESGKVSVFDRFGKLIKTFSINDVGWDGYYNGNKTSTNDYWFIAELVDLNGNTRIRKGHFSLIRK
ncbi:T9SS type B sorting domain-containing protein [Polaribacter pectinis]|uniref:T9SS type B sorting domain-containing protein n=1 Tax=Polaribacter pectinis TaxID=2738844 RepID=A0A7G9L7W2_9FLAO|nr:T9SS type B sorting domain-containing protein [Polaribacter pectinis]QNM84711.1 T9SS type B sorting domain-containing protein [Polaribacter pectinis]